MPGTRRSKRDKPVGTLRRHVADNIRILRDVKYKDLKTATARNRKLAKDADMSFSQVQRILSCDLGTSVDFLESLADALETRPSDLVTPYFAAKYTGDPIPLRPRRKRA